MHSAEIIIFIAVAALVFMNLHRYAFLLAFGYSLFALRRRHACLIQL